tara:strand:- start:81 stop:824 length:744 start_codon:yes stop_codon:yes gene_type:complete
MGFNKRLFPEAAAPCTVSNLDYPVSGTALYQMENNSNSTDSSSFNGTDANMSYDSSVKKFGSYSASFNGSSSTIALPNNCFNFTALTISAWIYPAGSGERVILETYNYTASPGSQGWIFKIDSATNKALMRAHNGDCASAYPTSTSCTDVTEVFSNSAISTSDWTHVAVTLDSSNMKMYINGTAQSGNTNLASNGFTYNATSLTNIGCMKYGSAAAEQFYNGKIDQLRVYNSALSASNISNLASESC